VISLKYFLFLETISIFRTRTIIFVIGWLSLSRPRSLQRLSCYWIFLIFFYQFLWVQLKGCSRHRICWLSMGRSKRRLKSIWRCRNLRKEEWLFRGCFGVRSRMGSWFWRWRWRLGLFRSCWRGFWWGLCRSRRPKLLPFK